MLWKAKKGDEPFWATPFGDGRPGLAHRVFGHGDGIPRVKHSTSTPAESTWCFPHHENEIAQSESITGRPFARFWLHSEHLHIESQKMSKSLGNFYTLRDLLKMGYQPEAIRYLLASGALPEEAELHF